MRKRGGRKRAVGTRAPAAMPQQPNQRRSLDFVSDTLDDGRRFRSSPSRAARAGLHRRLRHRPVLGCAAAVRSTGPTTVRPDPIAVGRRNWTFAGSDTGGHRAAVLYALIETVKLNGVDPQACLADVLVRLPDHPN